MTRPSILLQVSSGLVRDGKPVTDWPSIRQWVLDRDGKVCQLCMASPATDVDHIWPRRLGGRDHVENLRAACGPCNKAKGSQVHYALATESELHAAVDALSTRAEAVLDELLPLVGWFATAHPEHVTWTCLRLSTLERILRHGVQATRAAAERQRVYDDVPDAEVVTFPRVVKLDAETRIAYMAMRRDHWTQYLAYIPEVQPERADHALATFAELAPYLGGDVTTEEAVKTWQAANPGRDLP